MKRSEALKHIFETLELAYSHPEGNAKLAADILGRMEEIGMLPPFNDWLYHMDGDRADSENTRYLSWEPEDEEK
jgi:hypothetical protein